MGAARFCRALMAIPASQHLAIELRSGIPHTRDSNPSRRTLRRRGQCRPTRRKNFRARAKLEPEYTSRYKNEVVSLSIRTVVKHNIETPRHCNNKLLTSLERMACPSSTSGNIIKVENPLDLERHMPTTFNGREIACRIRYFR